MSGQIVVTVACFALICAPLATGQQQVTPPPPILVTSPIVTINNSAGNQIDPHVSKDLVAYTDQSSSQIRYYRFSTGVNTVIPNGGNIDLLSDVDGDRITFSRIGSDRNAIFVFDTLTSTLTEIDAHAGSNRLGTAIGGNTVAFIDFSVGNGDLYAFDLANPSVAPVSVYPSPTTDQNPNVSPDGNTIVWENCTTSVVNCDVFKAVRSGGMWTVSPVANSPDPEGNPDTDGTWIVHDANHPGNPTGQDTYYQLVSGGLETQIVLPGDQRNPSIKKGFICFESSSPADIFVYDIASNVLYQVTATPSVNETLNDISVLDNGDIRVVWAADDGPLGETNIYGTTFTPVHAGDFSFDSIVPLTLAAGGAASTTVTVNAVNGFSSAVNLSVAGQPAGVTATLTPDSVTPSGGNSASSALNLSAAAFVVPTNFTLTVTGASGSLSHSATANVTVTANPTSVSNSIGDMLNAGCIDNAGIGNALTSKLSAAQSAGNVQTAINTLTALKNQIQAQAGKHIHTACTIGGVAFNPINVLLLDVQALIDSLRVNMIPDPITGYVTDGGGVGLAGATVSVFNSGGAVVATSSTDITGFYFFATTGVLTPGASYTIAVTGLPAGFANVTPPTQAFTWQGSSVAFGNFAAN